MADHRDFLNDLARQLESHNDLQILNDLSSAVNRESVADIHRNLELLHNSASGLTSQAVLLLVKISHLLLNSPRQQRIYVASTDTGHSDSQTSNQQSLSCTDYGGTDPSDANFHKLRPGETEQLKTFHEEFSSPFPVARKPTDIPTMRMKKYFSQAVEVLLAVEYVVNKDQAQPWLTLFEVDPMPYPSDDREYLIRIVNPAKLANATTLIIHDGQFTHVDVGFCTPDVALLGLLDATILQLIAYVDFLVPQMPRLKRIVWMTGYVLYTHLVELGYIDRAREVNNVEAVITGVLQHVGALQDGIQTHPHLHATKIQHTLFMPLGIASINRRNDSSFVDFVDILIEQDQMFDRPYTSVVIVDALSYEKGGLLPHPWCIPLVLVFLEDILSVRLVIDRSVAISFYSTYEQAMLSALNPGLNPVNMDARGHVHTNIQPTTMAKTNQIMDLESVSLNIPGKLTMMLTQSTKGYQAVLCSLLVAKQQRAQNMHNSYLRALSAEEIHDSPILPVIVQPESSYDPGKNHALDVCYQILRQAYKTGSSRRFWQTCNLFLSQLKDDDNPLGVTKSDFYGSQTMWLCFQSGFASEKIWEKHATVSWMPAIHVAFGADICAGGLLRLLQLTKDDLTPARLITLVLVSGDIKILDIFAASSTAAVALRARYIQVVSNVIIELIIWDEASNGGRMLIRDLAASIGIHIQHMIAGIGDINLAGLFGVLCTHLPQESVAIIDMNVQVFHLGKFANSSGFFIHNPMILSMISQHRVIVPLKRALHSIKDESVPLLIQPSVFQWDNSIQRLVIPEVLDALNQTTFQLEQLALKESPQKVDVPHHTQAPQRIQLSPHGLDYVEKPMTVPKLPPKGDEPGSLLRTAHAGKWLGRDGNPPHTLLPGSVMHSPALRESYIRPPSSICFATNSHYQRARVNRCPIQAAVTPTGVFVELERRFLDFAPFRGGAPPVSPLTTSTSDYNVTDDTLSSHPSSSLVNSPLPGQYRSRRQDVFKGGPRMRTPQHSDHSDQEGGMAMKRLSGSLDDVSGIPVTSPPISSPIKKSKKMTDLKKSLRQTRTQRGPASPALSLLHLNLFSPPAYEPLPSDGDSDDNDEMTFESDPVQYARRIYQATKEMTMVPSNFTPRPNTPGTSAAVTPDLPKVPEEVENGKSPPDLSPMDLSTVQHQKGQPVTPMFVEISAPVVQPPPQQIPFTPTPEEISEALIPEEWQIDVIQSFQQPNVRGLYHPVSFLSYMTECSTAPEIIPYAVNVNERLYLRVRHPPIALFDSDPSVPLSPLEWSYTYEDAKNLPRSPSNRCTFCSRYPIVVCCDECDAEGPGRGNLCLICHNKTHQFQAHHTVLNILTRERMSTIFSPTVNEPNVSAWAMEARCNRCHGAIPAFHCTDPTCAEMLWSNLCWECDHMRHSESRNRHFRCDHFQFYTNEMIEQAELKSGITRTVEPKDIPRGFVPIWTPAVSSRIRAHNFWVKSMEATHGKFSIYMKKLRSLHNSVTTTEAVPGTIDIDFLIHSVLLENYASMDKAQLRTQKDLRGHPATMTHKYIFFATIEQEKQEPYWKDLRERMGCINFHPLTCAPLPDRPAHVSDFHTLFPSADPAYRNDMDLIDWFSNRHRFEHAFEE